MYLILHFQPPPLILILSQIILEVLFYHTDIIKVGSRNAQNYTKLSSSAALYNHDGILKLIQILASTLGRLSFRVEIYFKSTDKAKAKNTEHNGPYLSFIVLDESSTDKSEGVVIEVEVKGQYLHAIV